MGRIILRLAVAMVVLAMMLAAAVPAFARFSNCTEQPDGTTVCSGGEGERGGGSSGHARVSGDFTESTTNFGGGTGAGGPGEQAGEGSGFHSTSDFDSGCFTESGGGGIGGKGYQDVGEQPGGSGGHIDTCRGIDAGK